MKVNSIESPAIVYNLQHFWLLYTMTGYSIEWPIIHIDRNIYTLKSEMVRARTTDENTHEIHISKIVLNFVTKIAVKWAKKDPEASNI